jgi:GT2 family glycosyltransferase
MPIPVIGIPVLNRADLLLRMVRSIDYPVDKLIIINNGDDAGVSAILNQLQGEKDYNLEIYKPGYNLGVAASWNWIIKNNLDADYWLLIGNDIQLSSGDLAKMDRFIRDHPEYATVPANWGHSLFAVTQAGLDGVGYFDESFWPAYSEDQDWMYRMKLSGLPWSDCPDVKAVHGEPPLWGSSTVWSDPELNKKCGVTQKNNLEFYKRKWGGVPGDEKFLSPHGDPIYTIKDCPRDKYLLEANGHPEFQEGACK